MSASFATPPGTTLIRSGTNMDQDGEPILLVAAIDREISPACARLGLTRRGTSYSGRAGGSRVLAITTGVGVSRAVAAARQVIDRESIRRMVVVGFAAGSDPALLPGTVVHATSVQNESGDTVQVSHTEPGPNDPTNTAHGPMLSVERVVTSPTKKLDLYKQHGCIAVDMEGYGLATLGRELGIPVEIVKAVSDPATMVLPSGIERWVTEQGSPNISAILLDTIVRPWQLPDTIRLGRNAKLAASRLADDLAILIEGRSK